MLSPVHFHVSCVEAPPPSVRRGDGKRKAPAHPAEPTTAVRSIKQIELDTPSPRAALDPRAILSYGVVAPGDAIGLHGNATPLKSPHLDRQGNTSNIPSQSALTTERSALPSTHIMSSDDEAPKPRRCRMPYVNADAAAKWDGSPRLASRSPPTPSNSVRSRPRYTRAPTEEVESVRSRSRRARERVQEPLSPILQLLYEVTGEAGSAATTPDKAQNNGVTAPTTTITTPQRTKGAQNGAMRALSAPKAARSAGRPSAKESVPIAALHKSPRNSAKKYASQTTETATHSIEHHEMPSAADDTGSAIAKRPSNARQHSSPVPLAPQIGLTAPQFGLTAQLIQERMHIQLAELLEKVAEKEAELERSREVEATLADEIICAENQTETAFRIFNTINSETEEINEECAQCCKHVNELQAEAEVMQMTNYRIESKIVRAFSAANERRAAAAARKAAVDKLEDAVKTTDRQPVQALKVDLAELEMHCAALQSEIDELACVEDDLKCIEDRFVALETCQKLMKTRKTHTALQQLQQAGQTERKGLVETLSKLHTELPHMELDRRTFHDDIAMLTREVQQEASDLHHIRDEIEEAEHEMAHLRTALLQYSMCKQKR